MGGADFGGELFLLFAQGAEITLDLQAMPKLGGLAEEGSEADGHYRRDRAVAQHDLVDCAGCHTDGTGHGVLGNPHRSEIFLQQDFTGCDGRVHAYDV